MVLPCGRGMGGGGHGSSSLTCQSKCFTPSPLPPPPSPLSPPTIIPDPILFWLAPHMFLHLCIIHSPLAIAALNWVCHHIHCKNSSVTSTPNLLYTHTCFHFGVSMEQIRCVGHTTVCSSLQDCIICWVGLGNNIATSVVVNIHGWWQWAMIANE